MRVKKKAVAVDVGTSFTKIVAINYHAGACSVDLMHKFPTPDAVFAGDLNVGLLSAALKKAVQDCGLQRQKAISLVQAEKIITRHIKLPFMPPQDREKAVRWEAEKYIPLPVEELTTRFLPLGTITENSAGNSGGSIQYQHLLLAAVYTGAAHNYYDAFKLAGLSLEILDLQCLALWRLFYKDAGLMSGLVSNEVNAFVVAEIGVSAAHIVFIEKGFLRYTRSFPVAFSAAIVADSGVHYQREDGVPDTGVEGLINELRLSLEYYWTREPKLPVEKVFLTGGVSKSEMLLHALSMALNLPVEVLLINIGGQDIDPEFALVTGLALRQAGKRE